jgi:hypothetical protein
MRRAAEGAIAVTLLLTLGLALSSVLLEPDFDPPGHYDGDDDDAGLIWRTLSQWADIPIAWSLLPFVRSMSRERLAPSNPVPPPRIARDPLGSRAPPA